MNPGKVPGDLRNPKKVLGDLEDPSNPQESAGGLGGL